MNSDVSCFLNNIVMILIAVSAMLMCKRNPAFESDAKVHLVKPNSSKKQAPPLGTTSPSCLRPPANVPISPNNKEDDTLAEVKSLKSDNEKLRKTEKK